MQHENENETGIRVTVVPLQSAFFAGEPFSVKVTFTNTHSKDKPSATGKRSVSHPYSHRRAAHSVSLAPMAQPPTSPMTPKTAVPSPLRMSNRGGRSKKQYERRGLVGCETTGMKASNGDGPTSIWQKKAMSVSLTPQEVAAVVSPHIPSPLRDASFPANHPHARKHSELDSALQAHLQSAAQAQMQQLQLRELSASPAPTASASASTSAFSLALDTISESSSPSKQASHQYPPKRRPTHVGLGIGLPDIQREPPHSAFPSTFAQPGTELILYAYTQLGGSLTLEASQGDSKAHYSRLNSVRYSLQKMQAVGGGRMDITSSLDGAPAMMRRNSGLNQNRHTRSASLSQAFMNFLSPPPPTLNSPRTPTHKARAPSIVGNLITTSVSSPAKIGNSGEDDEVDEVPSETPLPTFDVQPAMLAVDLVLSPGESRSYTYTLPLPSNLPPTFRGKVMKFTYHLTVGVCRSNTPPGPSLSSRPRSGQSSSTSQVMRVPIRIYNHVNLTSTREPYDIFRPVMHSKSKGATSTQSNSPARVREIFDSGSGSPSSPTAGRTLSMQRSFSGTSIDSAGTAGASEKDPERDTKEELRDYAMRLLASTKAGNRQNVLPLPASASVEGISLNGPAVAEGSEEDKGDAEPVDCREAVEVLTRNMRKASYDVHKDGLKVAVLTFTKSAYRLGETIVGVVELNELASRARVLKLSVTLEAHESLPPSLVPSNEKPKRIRKQHAEYHASLTPNTQRASFALDIPSDATPAFQCICTSPPSSRYEEVNDAPGGLSWTVRLCLLVGIANEHARCGVAGGCTKGLVRDGPQGEWGASWRPTRGIAPLERVNLRAARRAAAARMESSSSGTLSKSSSGGKDLGLPQSSSQRGWMSSLISGLLSPTEREYHDGDEEPPESMNSSMSDLNRSTENLSLDEASKRDLDLGADEGGSPEEGWAELRAETVECEVPVRVWPGNTAFRPLEVVFDV